MKPKIEIDNSGGRPCRRLWSRDPIPWDDLKVGGAPLWYPFEEVAGTLTQPEITRMCHSVSTSASNRRRVGGKYQTRRGFSKTTKVAGCHIWRVE